MNPDPNPNPNPNPDPNPNNPNNLLETIILLGYNVRIGTFGTLLWKHVSYQCFPVFPLREILIVAKALCFASIRASLFSHLKNIKIPWTAMLHANLPIYLYYLHISLSTYSRISSEPLNKVSGLSFISVSKDLPIVSCLLENFSNSRSF